MSYQDFLNAVDQRLQTRDIALIRDVALFLSIDPREAFLFGLLAHYEGKYLMDSTDVGSGIGVGMRDTGYYDEI